MNGVRVLLAFGSAFVALNASAQSANLQPVAGAASMPAPPWHVAGLPHQSKPFTRFSTVDIDGKRALRIEADRSYGNLVHPLAGLHVDAASPTHLAWQWRAETLVAHADLREKSGDDTSLKVCVSFDLPLDKVSFGERQLLRYARSQTSEPVPAATICYVWDTALPPDTALDNAFTRRMRYLVLESGPAKLDQWVAERRDVGADFARLFGAESATVPNVVAVGVGADADNTQSRSVGYVTGLTLTP